MWLAAGVFFPKVLLVGKKRPLCGEDLPSAAPPPFADHVWARAENIWFWGLADVAVE